MYRQTPTRTLYLYLTVQKNSVRSLKKEHIPIDYSLWGCCVSRLAGGLRLKVLAAEIGVGILSIIMACTLGCVAKYTKRGEMRIKRDWIANDRYTLQHSTNLFFPLGNHHHHAVDDIFLCIRSIVLYAWSGISSILLESSSHLQWRRS